jgi:hypothetical protein
MGVFFLSFSLSPYRTRGVTLSDERTFGKLCAVKQADSFLHRPSSLLIDKTSNKNSARATKAKDHRSAQQAVAGCYKDERADD